MYQEFIPPAGILFIKVSTCFILQLTIYIDVDRYWHPLPCYYQVLFIISIYVHPCRICYHTGILQWRGYRFYLVCKMTFAIVNKQETFWYFRIIAGDHTATYKYIWMIISIYICHTY